MEYYLRMFHIYKDVFSESRASTTQKRKIAEVLAEARDNMDPDDEGTSDEVSWQIHHVKLQTTNRFEG